MVCPVHPKHITAIETDAAFVGHNRDNMPLTVPIAHDFICPWCWVGLFQAKRLAKELGIQFDWRGYELFPEELEWPDYVAHEPPANKPPTLSRLDFLLHLESIEIPKIDRPKKQRTHNAHEAVEYAKTEGVADELVEAIYRAYWEEGLEINDPKVLKKIAKPIVDDLDDMLKAIEKKKFAHLITGFDDDAHKKGVYNVPTFFIGSERLAEQPYGVLRKAITSVLEDDRWSSIYAGLDFPKVDRDRPYVYICMVATIDGKTVSGDREDCVIDLGSKVDHKLMRRIEESSDAVLIGAQTLRATSKDWNPRPDKRFVLSNSGNLPMKSAFLSEGAPYVVTNDVSHIIVIQGVKLIRVGKEEVDMKELLRRMKTGLGIDRLLVLGGSEVNAQLLAEDLVDELFVTIAPKVKLGRDVPTYAGGEPLPQDELLNFRLVEQHTVANEVFLRYRRERKK